MDMFDLNLLIAAARSDHTRHDLARGLLAAASERPFAMSPLVLAGFVRVVTHKRAFSPPTPPHDAWEAVQAILAHPNVRVCGPGPEHLQHMRRLSLATLATGKIVADAQHAAVAMEHDCTWVTMDRDFALFEPAGLRWRLVR